MVRGTGTARANVIQVEGMGKSSKGPGRVGARGAVRFKRCLGLLGLLVLVPGCSSAPEMPPSFILISLDTVRADRLGLYGYSRATSPHLDGILGQGLVFDDAWTVSNNTLVAHASLSCDY